MIDEDLEALLPALESFHARFGRFFRRSEGRAFGRKYLIGLTLHAHGSLDNRAG